jgi:outer membrane protein OmpA-like peptidoglycan-associated protein
VRILPALAAAGLLAGCATARSSVALLADEGATTGGSVAVIDADSGAERGELTAINTRADVGGAKVVPRPVDPAVYAVLLAAIPPPPRFYTLYFVEGTSELTEASKPVLEELKKVVTEASDVQITGHTDTVGSVQSNDKLSYERALQVRAALVKEGLPVANARVAGRGERELKTPTADGVSEPTNRRVEVTVR